MNKDFAILLVDSAAFYTTYHGQKSHFESTEICVENTQKHDVSERIYNDRKTAEKYFSERFTDAEIFTGYIGKKDIRKLKMEYGTKADPMQDVLEEIKTLGYMYTYVLPVFDRKSPEYREMKEEIDTRVSYGCFADIIAAEALDHDDIQFNLLQTLADHLEEVMR